MKVVLGLGNPGSQYARTRHNVGWWLADHLAARWAVPSFRSWGPALVAGARVGDEPVWLAKPLTYMNRSGIAARWLCESAPVLDISRDLLVVVDDVALPPGRARFRPKGSAGGHQGLLSIEEHLGTREYARLRIGVGAPPPRSDLADWVLSPFDTPEDEEGVLALLPALAEGVEVWVREGIERAMSRYNR
ncbi:MAG: aminoacyl-tRNA hydrolase [Gemmatimonadetes bacterium]|nr:aminoacyl-tRNA hydrolase [Gemmatimonadota bacterium]